MRVLLLWPRNERAALNDDMSCCEPLPLEYLGGALQGAHDVAIYDERLDPALETYSREHEAPDVVGIAIPYTTSIRPSRRLAQEAKRLWPQATLVLGGHHPTVSSEWINDFDADWVVAGEGGPALRALVDALEKGQTPPEMPGLAPYRRRNLLLRGGKPQASLLQSLPHPDRALVRHHAPRYFHSIYRPVSLMRFSAGCPYQCNFCSLWRMTDRRYLVKEADRVVEELGSVYSDNVYVVDDEAFIQSERMLSLADAINAAGFQKRYHMYVRTDTALRRPDVIRRWASIGLDSVLVGAESMTAHELDEYAKGTSPHQTRDALGLFHDAGIKVRANFIVDPKWEDADFDQLERTIAELGVDMPSFSVLTPLPGTDLYDDTRDEIVTDDPDMFDLYHSVNRTTLPVDRFQERLSNLLLVAAGRGGEGSESIFYYGNDDAFARMVRTVRDGHRHMAVEA